MKGTEGFMARVQVVVLIISKGKTLPFLPSSLPHSPSSNKGSCMSGVSDTMAEGKGSCMSGVPDTMAEGNLGFLVFLPLPPKCWDYNSAPPGMHHAACLTYMWQELNPEFCAC
jgi:hypothetical protein